MSVTYSVNALPDLIRIGVETENGVEQIAFDAADWMVTWPDMRLSVWAQEPKADVMYEAQAHRDGAMIVWDVSAQDTRMSGYGAVLVMGETEGGERKLSARVRTYIRQSGMNATADAPEAHQPWYTSAMEAARQAGADAGRAEDAAARAEAAEDEIDAKREDALTGIENAKADATVSIEEKTDEQMSRIPEVTALSEDVSALKDDMDYVNNSTAEPVPSGRLWSSTEDGAGWANPGFKLIQSLVVQDVDEINRLIVELSGYKYRIVYVFIKLPAGSYDRCMISFSFAGAQVYQHYPYIGTKSEDFCFYALVGYDGDAPIALGTESDKIVYSSHWLKDFKSGNKLAYTASVGLSNNVNFPAGMEIYIYGKE